MLDTLKDHTAGATGAAQAEQMDAAARSRHYRQVAADLTALLLREFPDDIRAVVLFGSVARGEAHAESDVDLLVITDAPRETRDRMGNAADDLCQQRFQDTDELLPCQLLKLTTAGFEKEAITYRSYLAQDIMEQGIALYDDGAYKSVYNKTNNGVNFTTMAPTKAFITRQMELAQEYLNDCIATYEQGRWRTAVDRAYYAMYHSAVALLCHVGTRPPRSHRGLAMLIGREVVSRGLIAPEFGDMLIDSHEDRIDSAYSGDADITEDIAQTNVENARRFVAKIQETLSSDACEGA